MLNADFPLYSIRAHIEFREEPPYQLIVTKYGEYVLDYIDKHKTYAERRLDLLTAGSGYKLYPLKERFNSIAAVINSDRKMFIDANGKILTKGGDNRSYRTCIHKKVLHYEVAYNGKYRLFTKDDIFVTDRLGYFVEYIELGGSRILLNVMDSLDNKRVRVLI